MSDDDAQQLRFPIGHSSLRYVAFTLRHDRREGWSMEVWHAHDGERLLCQQRDSYEDMTLTEAIDAVIGVLSHANDSFREVNGVCVPR